jgi:GTPase SAR1 family protein
MASRVPEQKVILCGDFGVGKSSLFRRYMLNNFLESSDRKVTIGNHFLLRFNQSLSIQNDFLLCRT